jgi:hypothetical protein
VLASLVEMSLIEKCIELAAKMLYCQLEYPACLPIGGDNGSESTSKAPYASAAETSEASHRQPSPKFPRFSLSCNPRCEAAIPQGELRLSADASRIVYVRRQGLYLFVPQHPLSFNRLMVFRIVRH